MRKRILSALLCLCLLLSATIPAYAVEIEEAETARLSISTVERLLTLAEKCRLDSYSCGLVVSLEADLDVSGVDFAGIPSFSGTFEGNGHTISGLALTADGSIQGFFRYLTDTAVVRDLHIRGTVAPGGSRSEVGGLAGSNAGRIENCSFNGTVSGNDNVGGLVGVNTVSGIIEDGRVTGSVCGNHFAGGIAGKNNGVIRGSNNNAAINSTPQENSVKLSDVTMESLLNSEAINTVTDIGGIAGNSSGVIRDCVNYGSVGYQHMGYNIGGIAGTQSGYILDCENRGQVLGRKEVGGIVGQMEPTALVEYDEDALQILQGQLKTMSGIANKTAANVQGTAEAIYGQVGTLQEQVQDAKDAVGMLLPDRDDPQLPDLDSIQAAQNNLSSSLSGMGQTLQGMQATTQSAIGTLSNNLYALQNQINAMSATLGNVSETLGGSITDVSDADTEADLTGKVEGCTNSGTVLGDLNIGGITGAMALENDLDPEDDWKIEGENSLNFQSELRAVILNCENSATVTASKRSAGGIVGWQVLGLVKNSRNTGDLDTEEADYVGGIAGQSTGYIRQSSVKCTLSGDSYVGGIAGSATIVTDCRSMVELNGTEGLGSILGIREESNTEEETPVAGNFYLTVSKDFGGIDGISYDGLAQPLTEAEFFVLEDLPSLFRNVTVMFLFDDGTYRQITVTSGGKLAETLIPALPEKAGFVGEWEDLEEADLSNIIFNLTFEAKYTAYSTTLQSSEVRENGLPVLLVQGDFTADATVKLSEPDAVPQLGDKETLLETWAVAVSEPESITAARWQLPEGCDSELVSVQVRDNGGTWRTVEHSVDGSYVVFALDGGSDTIALLQTEAPASPLFAAGAGGVLAAAMLAGLLVWRRKKRSGRKRQEEQTRKEA